MVGAPVVLHIAHVTKNAASGVSAVVPCYLAHQAASGVYHCALLNLCTRNPFDTTDGGFPVFIGSRLDDLPHPFSAPNLVVFHEIYRLQFIGLSKQLEKQGIPYIIVPHGSLTKEAQCERKMAKSILNAVYFNVFVRHAACLHYLSEGELIRTTVQNQQHFILGNGVDDACPVACEKKKQFLFLGRLDIRVKGLDLLLRGVAAAAAILRASGCNVMVAGPSEGGSLEKLRRTARSLKVDDLISFPGMVRGEEKNRLYSESLAYLQLSRTEALPTSVLEAMSYGLPVIVTQGTSMKDVVEQNDLGYGVESTSESVADALRSVASHPERAKEQGSRAREFVRANYTWDRVAQQQIQHYLSVLEKPAEDGH